MPFDLVIRGAAIVGYAEITTGDIAIANGLIAEVAPSISGTTNNEIDASHLHVFPGMIDPHVHFNEPGRADWEGVSTGSSALAAGGGTCFFDMPLNSSPPLLDRRSFDAKFAAASKQSFTDFAFWGGLTPANLDSMSELADCGVVGFKAFLCDSGLAEFPMADDLTLYRGMKRARELGLAIAVHAESQTITSRLLAVCTGHSPRDWLGSRPIVAEVEAVSRAIILAEETGCALHIVHVSNSRCTELVRRSEGDVSCETCPHYLSLTENDVERLGAVAKCAPPLRSAGDVDEMWQDLAAGKIAFVGSDHSPCPPAMKNASDFFSAWGGISGVQMTLPILLSRGPSLPLPKIAHLTSRGIAERFNLPGKRGIAVGAEANLALIDVAGCFELTQGRLLDRHKLSPYLGRTFHGIIRRTLLRGNTIFQDGRVVGEPTGRLVKPARP